MVYRCHRQRQETFVTMNAIMHYQEEFFLDGDETKPMILKTLLIW
jgi:RNA polymerase sigma-54 factor